MGYNWQKRMIILRGLPGSGKSTLASDMFHNDFFDPKAQVDYLVEGDDYRTIEGEYRYDPDQNFLAQAWCCSEAFRRLQSQDIIFVANVFAKREHIFPYLEWARKLEVRVLLIETSTPWARNAQELVEKNVHEVPLESIEHMMEAWEKISQDEVEILVGHPWEAL